MFGTAQTISRIWSEYGNRPAGRQSFLVQPKASSPSSALSRFADQPALGEGIMLRIFLATFAALISLIISGPPVAQVISMPAREAPIDAPGVDQYQASVATFDAVATFGEIVLSPPSTAELAKAKIVGRTESIAFGRVPMGGSARVDIPADTTQARLIVTSPGAQMVRAALIFSDASDYQIAAWSPDSDVAVLMTSSSPRAFGQPIWTPVTSGARQILVVTRRSNDGQPWTIGVPKVSHFYANAFSASVAQPKVYGQGTSAFCQLDFICVVALGTPSAQQALLASSRPVALLILTYSDGTSQSCTGTLLNTASYPATVMITANHCVAGDAGTLTLTALTTVWFFSRTTCGSTAVGNYVQIVNSGRTLWHSLTWDGALLYLNEVPPYPASYSGWTADQVPTGTTVLGIHHPRADVKKASFATVVGTNSTPVTIGVIGYLPGTFFVVDWDVGIVEPGSSGSGMFALDPSGLSLSLRGTLTGGSATCTNTGARTYYSELANMYPEIQALLTQPIPPKATTTVAVEYYYSVWNFYFETAFPDEIAALDGGAFGGAWKRTGETFNVWPQSNSSTSPTCRFFSTAFAPKSSHFYTPFASECAIVKTESAWQYEAIAFYIQLADANGLCSGGTIPLYRLYNNGMGAAPNHRYTTSVTVFNQMVAAGWIFEGNGNTKVFACVPQ